VPFINGNPLREIVIAIPVLDLPVNRIDLAPQVLATRLGATGLQFREQGSKSGFKVYDVVRWAHR
jgi:hypothetical protein